MKRRKHHKSSADPNECPQGPGETWRYFYRGDYLVVTTVEEAPDLHDEDGWLCGCSWYGWRGVAHLVFLVVGVEAERGSARCLALDYDLQEEMSSTAAYSFRVGELFRTSAHARPLWGAEPVAA